MILLDDIVHILAGPALAFLREKLLLLKIADGANVGGVLIDVDHSWGGDVGPAQDFVKETLSRSSAPGLIQEEIECLAG